MLCSTLTEVPIYGFFKPVLYLCLFGAVLRHLCLCTLHQGEKQGVVGLFPDLLCLGRASSGAAFVCIAEIEIVSIAILCYN